MSGYAESVRHVQRNAAFIAYAQFFAEGLANLQALGCPN